MFGSSAKTRHKIEHPPRWLITCALVLTYILTVLPLRLLYRARRSFLAEIRSLERGSLIIANHQSMVDPFVITMNLPFLAYLKLVPIYFPVTSEYMRKPIVGFLMRLLGCYDVGISKQEKMQAFFHTRKLIQQGQTVFLFPEGKISHNNIKEFERGIEFFFKEAKRVMFVKISGFNRVDWVRPWKIECSIVYGEAEESRGSALPVSTLRNHLAGMTEMQA
ncbi:MAG: lysophospholipid acyltransferase family protein [bacterium]|nr:lysophospholipid acyltransferase family protein [bacterium]